MNGETQHYDDERLLAHALGLELDPELETALAGDPELQERVAAMRADVGAVAAGLDRVVPAPPDDYADPSDPRWGELRQFVTAPAPAAPRRRSVWLRVLVPAAAIALVLVAGVVGVQRLGTVGGNEEATVAEDEKTQSYDREGGALSGAPATDGSEGSYEDTDLEAFWRVVPDRDAYATVVIGRALAPTANRQLFEVLRVLRGEAEDYVSLRMTGRALAPDALALLYLEPREGTAAGALSPPSPQSQPTGGGVSSKVFTYRFRGAPAQAQRLPAGSVAGDFTLP